jgi:hypothetical protein
MLCLLDVRVRATGFVNCVQRKGDGRPIFFCICSVEYTESLTTVDWLVKNEETSSSREALSAISSAGI